MGNQSEVPHLESSLGWAWHLGTGRALWHSGR